MKGKNILYLVLGFGSGLVLCGAIGLIISLNVDIYINNYQNEHSNSVDNENKYDNKEYKIEEYIKDSQNSSEIKDSVQSKEHDDSDNQESQQVVETTPTKTNQIQNTDNGQQNDNEAKEEYVYVEISEELGATQICQLLESHEVIEDASEFLEFVRKEDKQTRLLDGKIKFQKGMSNEQVLKILTKNN